MYRSWEKVMKPPKHLRHIPYIGYFSVFKSLISGESFWDRTYKVVIPQIEAKESNGLYLEYGRFGWEIFICNTEDARQVFLKQDIFQKSSITDGLEDTFFARFITGKNLVTAKTDMWKSQRKVANPAFKRAMPVKLFGELAQEMFLAMENMGETINVSNLIRRYTLDVIGKGGFGFDFKALSDPNSEWVITYEKINEDIEKPFFYLFPVFDKELVWMFPDRVKAHREMDRFLNMLDEVIVNKRNILEKEKGDNEKDLLTLMIESENRGEGLMSNEELKSNLCVFFLAGHDTTTSALIYAIHYLAKYPEIQARARQEAISILGDEPIDVLPTVEESKQMIYINQIMKETLRINTPVPVVIPRVTMQDVILSGTFIPKGSLINVGLYTMHHIEKYWKDSKQFNPNRFSPENKKNDDQENWLPFGYGGRQCIGMNFSLTQQRVLLSMLLRKYTWKTPETSIHKEQVVPHGFVVVGIEELDINFQKRY